jgi:glycosyltransferase involved in cell wall biosynthesis
MVSVIIPNYNHASFLQQRIDTVLAQTYSDFEVILLDDCSTDDSGQIIEQYRHHPKVSHIVYNKSNSGNTFQQWKKGIALAEREWIWIAESDDYAHPDFLAKLIHNAAKGEAVVLSYCQSNEVDENNIILGNMSSWTADVDADHWLADYTNDGRNETLNYLSVKNTIPNASAVIFKRSAYLQVDDAHIQLKYCGDWFLWIKLLQTGDVAYTAQPLNFFRKHASTTRTMNSFVKYRKRLEEEYEMLQYIKQNIGLSRSDFSRRLKRIIALYAYAFTKGEMAGYIFLPFRYKGPIPFHKVLAGYLRTRLGRSQTFG